MPNCKQCSANFEIRVKDRKFYKQFDAPDPTICPPCREQRRLSFRNETSLWKGKCGICDKSIVTSYASDVPFDSVCSDCFYGNDYDAMKYGCDFDFNRPFFEQFKELRDKVARMGMVTINCINSDYTSYTGDCKNCYLISAGEKSEDCYYSKLCQNNTDIMDSDYIWDSELCYGCINISKCYHCINSYQLENCNDCHFCFDLIGCKNCLFSYNQRNKEYYIFNKKVEKEEYEKQVTELKLNTYSGYQKALRKWKEIVKKEAIHKGINIINCENSTGDNLKNCRNMHECFDMQKSDDCGYCAEGDAISTYDANNLYYKPELNYEVLSNLQINRVAFSMFIYYCNDTQYSDLCYHSENLFGCVGLQRKKFCIFNKQYSEEEYKNLRIRIIEHMKSTGEWGEFFPHKISPYGYNESLAYEYYPLDKATVEAKGWNWRDRDDKVTDVEKSVKADKLPDDINKINDQILKWAIICEESGRPFKIIPQELSFYRKQGLPLPRKAPFERHMDRQALRRPRKLWERKCNKCETDIQSSISSNGTEKVYCETCYLKEIY